MHWRLHAVRAGVPKKRRRFSLVRKHRGLLAQFEALESRCLLSGNSGSQIGTIFASKLAAQSHWLSPQFKLLNQGDLAPRVSSSPTGLTPSIIRQAYGFNQVLFDGGIIGDGTGQTIAIVDAYHAPTIKNDLHAFDLAFGLPDPPSFVQVAQNGSTNFPSVDPAGAGAASGTWEVETALDVEWAHALAPGANILLVEANSPSDDDLIQAAVGFARSQPNVVAVSMSFGGTEFGGQTAYDSFFTTPSGHGGVTFLAASGDDGEPSGYPAFSPNVVAVGGTTLSTDALGNYVSESGWSGSGGSISTVETLPAYQAGVVTQSTVRRANPDVAFDADPASGVPVYDSYDFGNVTPWIQVGGTSFSTPAWSAIIAIADQGRALQGLSSLDGATQTLPLLYQLPSTSYHDITSGNNGFAAATGYDLVTGLGTPRVASIVGGLIGASISGTVFADADGNGVKDTGEIGLAGWTVFDDLNNDGVLQASSTASFNSSDVPKAIPDQKTITSTTTVSNVLGPISDVNVTLTIHHTFDRDLVITLIAPDGTKVTLANRNGSSADNFINTVFDDQANVSITSGSAPFTGTFRPVGLLANLNGKIANGIWTLQVADVTRQDSGTLDSWSLSIATAGEPSDTTDTSGGYQFVDVPPGDHHIREIPQTPFVQTSPVGAVYNVIMGTGSRVSNQDFGNAPVQPMVVPTVLGDFNKDGKTTGDDVPVLLLALTDPETYKATYNVTDAGLLMFGDLDGDHALTNADLQALLTLLNSGNSGGNPAVITTAASLNTVPTIVASSVSARLVAPNASSPVSQVVQPAGQDVVNAGTRYPIPSLHSRAIDAVLSRTGAFRSRHFRGRLEEPTAIHFGTLLG